MKRAVVAIYIDPDFYPPTINAILNLADKMDEVVVISRNNSILDYPYPTNVYLKKTGKPLSVRDAEKLPAWKKLFYFLKFTLSLYRLGRKKKTDLLLIYDPLALFAFFLVKHIRRGKKVWYHNHDMPNRSLIKRFSIGGFAAKYEAKAMGYIDSFSLPSKERLAFYPSIKPTIPVFIIPNYPSLKVYSNLCIKQTPNNIIKIIYQGFIGKGHSLETFIQLLADSINGFELNLILKGPVTDSYKFTLNELAEKYKVADKLRWEKIGPYAQLPLLTASCDIGIGINCNSDAVSKTQATASNKIYEYAASGLPVILYDSEQFTKQLQEYKWAFFTDGSLHSIKEQVEAIIKDWKILSDMSRQSFLERLNFERYFIPALNAVLNTDISKQTIIGNSSSK